MPSSLPSRRLGALPVNAHATSIVLPAAVTIPSTPNFGAGSLSILTASFVTVRPLIPKGSIHGSVVGDRPSGSPPTGATSAASFGTRPRGS